MLALASALLIAAGPPTQITSGPANGSTVAQTRATFSFVAPGRPGQVSYECSLDGSAAFGPCDSPYTVTGLGAGLHSFSVRAIESNETGPTSTRVWTVQPDADGDGAAPPADCDDANPAIHPGASEIPSNGLDDDCTGGDHNPVVTPPDAPPAPPATPAPAVKGKIEITLSYFMHARRRATTFSTLAVKGVPKGATIKVTCTGGCARAAQTIRNAKGALVSISGFRNTPIRPGAKLTISVTKTGMSGMAKVIRIRSGKRPTITTATLP